MSIPVEVEAAIRDVQQMADIMVILMERCDGEIATLRRHINPAINIADMAGLSVAIFQAYEIRKRAKELADIAEAQA